MVIITYAGCFVTKISVYVYEYHLQHVKTIRFFLKFVLFIKIWEFYFKKKPNTLLK